MVLSICPATETLNVVNTLVVALVAIAVLWLDQIHQTAGISSFLPGESRDRHPSLTEVDVQRNVHGAFGLFGSNAVLLIGMALVVLGALLVQLPRSRRAFADRCASRSA